MAYCGWKSNGEGSAWEIGTSAGLFLDRDTAPMCKVMVLGEIRLKDQPRHFVFFCSPLLIKLSPEKEQQCKLFLAVLQKGTFPRNQNVMLTKFVAGEG